jgi:hypothetical protein
MVVVVNSHLCTLNFLKVAPYNLYFFWIACFDDCILYLPKSILVLVIYVDKPGEALVPSHGG